MKKFQDTIMRDIGWKLLSVIIAITLWFMVINIEHPVDTRTYTQTIKFENADLLTAEGLTVKGLSELESVKVSIKVKAQRTVLDRLSQYKGNIKASIDLQKALGYTHGETLSLPVDIKLPDIVGTNLEIISRTPQFMEVSIEDLVTKRLKVEVALGGSAPSGYLVQDVVSNPDVVTVSGASSLVDKVAKVRADVNLDGMGSSSDVSVTPLACDSAGTIVRGVSILESEVNVHVNLGQSKKVTLIGNVTGIPASGYGIGEIVVSPTTIDVQGTKEALANLTEIQLPDVDVYDATRNVVGIFATSNILPSGVTLKTGGSESISVRVEIKQEGKSRLTIPTSSIIGGGAIKSGLSYTFDTDSLIIEVDGMSSTDSSTIDGITASADFSGITEAGHYTLKVSVNLPPGLTLSSAQPYVSISVVANPTTPTPPVEVPIEPPTETPVETPIETPTDSNTSTTVPSENTDNADNTNNIDNKEDIN